MQQAGSVAKYLEIRMVNTSRQAQEAVPRLDTAPVSPLRSHGYPPPFMEREEMRSLFWDKGMGFSLPIDKDTQ
jgi:hypothetical protein